MTRVALKKRLHQVIDSINDDDFLAAVYNLLNTRNSEVSHELSAQQWKEIDRRVQLHKEGKSKSSSVDDTIKYVRSFLKK